MDSGRKLFLRFLAMAFLMLGFVSDGTGGGVIIPCDPDDPDPNNPCCKRVVTFAGQPFSGILIGEQENGEGAITVTMFVTSIPLLPFEAAVTQLFRRDVRLLPGKTLGDLTEEEIQHLVIGDPSTAPTVSLCFGSLAGDPQFFLTTGAIRVRKLVGITPPLDRHPLVVGTTAFRWTQVFGFVIPEDFLADPLSPGDR